jgi:hypothetical protein
VSVRATNWAWEIGRAGLVSGGELLTLLRVADHADNEGRCWPGEESLAEYTGADERTVRRHLKKLEDAKLIHRERQPAAKGRGRAKDRIHCHLDQPDNLSGEKSGVQPDISDASTGQNRPVQPDKSRIALYREPPENPHRTERGRVVFTENAAAAWASAKGFLADHLPPETYLRDVAAIEVAGESDGMLVLLDTAGQGGGAWVDDRLRPILLEAVAGFDGVELVDQVELEDRGLDESSPTEQVFEAWRETWSKGPRTELSPERQRVIKKALASFPLEDVIDAVRGGRFSSHHRGENAQRKPYTHLKYFIGDADRIEDFRDLYRRHSGGQRQASADPALARITGREA